jgi:hypothetical protein
MLATKCTHNSHALLQFLDQRVRHSADDVGLVIAKKVKERKGGATEIAATENRFLTGLLRFGNTLSGNLDIVVESLDMFKDCLVQIKRLALRTYMITFSKNNHHENINIRSVGD